MNKTIIAYVIIGILILLLIIATLFPGMIYALRDSGVTGSSVEDKCTPDKGYTEESWAQHMSHHPNLYSECLG